MIAISVDGRSRQIRLNSPSRSTRTHFQLLWQCSHICYLSDRLFLASVLISSFVASTVRRSCLPNLVLSLPKSRKDIQGVTRIAGPGRYLCRLLALQLCASVIPNISTVFRTYPLFIGLHRGRVAGGKGLGPHAQRFLSGAAQKESDGRRQLTICVRRYYDARCGLSV